MIINKLTIANKLIINWLIKNVISFPCIISFPEIIVIPILTNNDMNSIEA